MKEVTLRIVSQTRVARDVYRMILAGDTTAVTAAGQFINIKLDGLYLRRPISVCDWEPEELTIIYKVVGKGTAQMAALPDGTELSVLTGLGNGYDLGKSGSRPLLIGGGVGVPPLYLAAKLLRNEGKTVTAVLGFNTAEDVFYADEFRALGVRTLVTTADGSVGTRGFVTDALADVGDYSYVFTCGPEPMLKAVYGAVNTDGQFSFEERMGCGFGACMGCTCKTKYGNKRICTDGPVLYKEEIVW
ncbi:MAG: dihydroorotate dehydrogenase electron transfer subunit [Clostridia bacterium]|nr:dihydroorotate dehydrogenase electron transfer subunit [Clostridia bacterium]